MENYDVDPSLNMFLYSYEIGAKASIPLCVTKQKVVNELFCHIFITY